MNNLPNSLLKKADKYNELSDDAKFSLLHNLYHVHGLSWGAVAGLCDTYPNKVRRDAKKLGINSKTKSQAQAAALESGRHNHPTKGKEHSEETKVKISDGVAKDWDNISEEERERRRDDARERWNQKSPEEIAEFRHAAGEGVRRAAKEGSALEKYLHGQLVTAGYKVELHKEYWAIRERLQIDLYLPELTVALEVDGPSHFDPSIWGKEVLLKNQKRDNEKTGLLLQSGCVIIRVRQKKSLSEKYKREILVDVLRTLNEIRDSRPTEGNRHIILGDD